LTASSPSTHPVRLAHGISKLDEFYRAPLELAGDQPDRQHRKYFSQSGRLEQTHPHAAISLPFNAIESKFLIGLTFRFMLRDIIYSSQRRNNQGVLQHRIGISARAGLSGNS
jgi:hypothetical protein